MLCWRDATVLRVQPRLKPDVVRAAQGVVHRRDDWRGHSPLVPRLVVVQVTPQIHGDHAVLWDVNGGLLTERERRARGMARSRKNDEQKKKMVENLLKLQTA